MTSDDLIKNGLSDCQQLTQLVRKSAPVVLVRVLEVWSNSRAVGSIGQRISGTQPSNLGNDGHGVVVRGWGCHAFKPAVNASLSTAHIRLWLPSYPCGCAFYLNIEVHILVVRYYPE